MLAGQSGTKQIIMITDGEPTAHLDDAALALQLPAGAETIETTMREVVRCTREGSASTRTSWTSTTTCGPSSSRWRR
jgi:uncharacterized protein with von Willebrand factor type A (vWA) domain